MTRIVSFGYMYGMPQDHNAVVIDVRPFCALNPAREPALRYLRGDHPAVARAIQRTPNFPARYRALRQRVAHAPADAIVYLGCTGGHHRSVYLALCLGQSFGVPVEHRDYYRAY